MKKIFSIILAVSLVFTLVPFGNLAVKSKAADEIEFTFTALKVKDGEDGVVIDVENNLVYGVPHLTSDLGSILENGEGYSVEFVNKSVYAGTGSSVVISKNETELATFKTVTYGDTNGDGVTDVLDIVFAERLISGKTDVLSVDKECLEAVKLTADGESVNNYDYSSLVNGILSGEEVVADRTFSEIDNIAHASFDEYIYTGTPLTPDFELTLNGKTLVKGVDYTVTYEKNEELGEALVTVSASENSLFAGSKVFKFTIPGTVSVKLPKVNQFLYRVGNANNVALSSLFATEGNIGVSTGVTVKNVAGNASGVYTASSTQWDAGALKFSGTGVVEVVVNDSLKLNLEVVNGKNATTALNATANNVVLLNDVDFSTLTVSGGYSLYGNGFTLKAPTDVACSGFHGDCGFVTLNNGNLDNVKIECPIFSEAFFYQADAAKFKDGNDKFTMSRCAVEAKGNSTISNSFISGGRAVIFTGDSCNSLLIEDSFIYGGTFCNMDLFSGRSVTLKNVTTAMEVQKVTDDSSTETIGLGIVVQNQNLKMTLEGTLKQYNWISKTQTSKYLSDFTFITDQIFKLDQFKHSYNGDTYINSGISYVTNWDVANVKDNMPTYLYDNRTDKGGYVGKDVTISGFSAGAYSVGKSVALTASEFEIPDFNGYGYKTTSPVFTYSNAVNNITKISDSEPYCTYSNGVISVATKDASKTLDFSGVSIVKDGVEMNYTVSVNSDKAQINGKSITFDSSVTDYTVTFTVSENGMGYNPDGSVKSGTTVFTYDIDVHIAVIAFPKPVWSDVSSTGSGQLWLNKSNIFEDDYSEAFPIYGGLTVVYYDKNGQEHTDDLSDETVIPSIDSGNQFAVAKLSNGCSLKISVSHSGYAYKLAGGKVYFYKSAVRDNKGNCSFTVKYTLTDPNGQTTESAASVKYVFTADSPTTEADYDSFIKGEIKDPGGCFATGTLITLADGTQKPVEQITFGDKILAWDFYTGTYVEQDVALLVYHGENECDVLNTVYSDGTVLRTIGKHGLFDYDLNKFVYITPEDGKDYVGHTFVKYNPDGSYDLIKMTDAYVTSENTGAYSITSAGTANAFAQGILTLCPPEEFYNWMEMGDKLRYDLEGFNADVEKYGLYDYEVFKDYATYEQFVAFNGAYLKIPVEKGIMTFEHIIELIEECQMWISYK